MSLGTKKKEQINLIPEDQRVTSLGSKVAPLLVAGVIIALQFGVFAFLKVTVFAQDAVLKKVSTELESQTPVWQKLEPIASAIKNIQAKKTTYDQTSSQYTGLDKKLDKIRDLFPEGVSLSVLNINNEGKVAITGRSVSADSAYQFYNVLKEQKEISALSFESISKTSSEYTFTLEFNINMK